MHSRLAELMEYAATQRAELLAAVDDVPVTRRDAKPEPSAWSVAEILEHLYRVETGIARLLKRGAERARAEGAPLEQEEGSLLGSLDAFRLTERSYVAAAPGPVLPRGDLTAAAGLAALADSRRALIDAASAASGLALGAITYPHPMLGALTLYQWILFVGQHELRHARQIQFISPQLRAATNPA
jgi:DinB superfamily